MDGEETARDGGDGEKRENEKRDGDDGEERDGDEGNPRDLAAPDDAPRAEPPRPSLDEPNGDPEAKPADRLSKQVPIGVLFTAAAAAILLFLFVVAVLAYVSLSPTR